MKNRFKLMVLINLYSLLAQPRLVIFPAHAISFALFRKLNAQGTSKLTEKERNTGRCTTQSSGKGVIVNGT